MFRYSISVMGPGAGVGAGAAAESCKRRSSTNVDRAEEYISQVELSG